MPPSPCIPAKCHARYGRYQGTPPSPSACCPDIHSVHSVGLSQQRALHDLASPLALGYAAARLDGAHAGVPSPLPSLAVGPSMRARHSPASALAIESSSSFSRRHWRGLRRSPGYALRERRALPVGCRLQLRAVRPCGRRRRARLHPRSRAGFSLARRLRLRVTSLPAIRQRTAPGR